MTETREQRGIITDATEHSVQIKDSLGHRALKAALQAELREIVLGEGEIGSERRREIEARLADVALIEAGLDYKIPDDTLSKRVAVAEQVILLLLRCEKFMYVSPNDRASHEIKEEISERAGLTESDWRNAMTLLRKKGIIETYTKPGRRNNSSFTLKIENLIDNFNLELITQRIEARLVELGVKIPATRMPIKPKVAPQNLEECITAKPSLAQRIKDVVRDDPLLRKPSRDHRQLIARIAETLGVDFVDVLKVIRDMTDPDNGSASIVHNTDGFRLVLGRTNKNK